MILPYKGKRDLLINGRHRKNYGDAPDAVVKVMEMQVGPRPVYGGPGRMKLKKTPHNIIVRGVQGSRGPLVGGRRIETAGPLVLSVMKEQRYVEKMPKRRPPTPPGN